MCSVVGLEPRQALLFESVSEYVTPGGLKNTRITEGMQRFILVRANQCPYVQQMLILILKSTQNREGGYNRVYRRKREI
jgi:hypothetical protein